MQLTGILLAGGKGTRMGQNKALIRIHDKLMIDYAFDFLSIYCSPILLISSHPFTHLKGAISIPDNYQDAGPLAGLEAGLNASPGRYSLVVPCDATWFHPDVIPAALTYMEGFDAVVPRTPDGKTEPLFAIYSRSVQPVVAEQIRNSDYKLMNLLKRIRTKYLELPFSPILNNLNTPEDLLKL